MNVKQNTKGFTIIEVVLVLAIAGLIFLMVFIALPALQAGQRDTARRSDVGNIASAVNSYLSNNRSTFPNSSQLQGYLTDVSGNTNKTSVTVQARPTSNSVGVTDGQVKVVTGAKCNPSGTKTNGATATTAVSAGSTRQFAVVTRLEAANGTAFCQDS